MEIKKTQIDDMNFRLSLNVVKEDYVEKKKKALNDFRKQADIKGFRKGMAPMSLIEKMHGISALVDSVNKVISDSLNKYIEDNKLNILGEPLPNDELQQKIDWEKDESYEFIFDLALSPTVDFNLSKDDKIVSYNVPVTKEAIANQKENILRQAGKMEVMELVGEDDFIVADLAQGDTKIENTYISLKTIENKTNKKKFLGKKVGDKIEVDVNKVFTNEVDRAALLKVKKEELANIAPDWEITLKEIKGVVPAVSGQEVYDRIFGKDVVKDEASFEAKIEEKLAAENQREADYRFMLDAREYLINKTNIKVPEAFMKRWLFTINEGKFTMADIEKDFDLFVKDFRWQLIRQYIMKEQKMQITKEELLENAKEIARYQFAMYGLNDVADEQLSHYAETLLSNEKEGRRIYEKAEENKVIDYIKSVVTLEPKEISIDEIAKLNA